MGRVLAYAVACGLLTIASRSAAQAPSGEPAPPSQPSEPLGAAPAPPPGASPSNAPPQPPPYPPAYPPGYYPAYPAPYAYPQAPAAPKPRDDQLPGYHSHDGFFMRLGGGLGYLNIDIEPETNAISNATLSGFGVTWEFDFGYAIVPGVVIGGGYGGMVAFTPRTEGTSEPQSNEAFSLTLGPFIDVFPNPGEGLEMGGMVGLAGVSYSFEDQSALIVRSETLTGVGGALWVGYNGWVSSNWSFGVLARGGIGWVEGRASAETPTALIETDQSGTSWNLALLFNPIFN